VSRRLCLDTSAYSHFKRGDRQVVELIDSADWIGVPGVVIGELAAGFRLGSRAEQNFRELDEFLAWPVVQELAVDWEAGRTFGEIVAVLKKAGTPMPTNDIWIAATCANAGATLVTYDGHFSGIGRVGSIVLRSGPH
jgi:tRNA(fMet)-specific endonuclease VapC